MPKRSNPINIQYLLDRMSKRLNPINIRWPYRLNAQKIKFNKYPKYYRLNA